jgi:hypothetical protein
MWFGVVSQQRLDHLQTAPRFGGGSLTPSRKAAKPGSSRDNKAPSNFRFPILKSERSCVGSHNSLSSANLIRHSRQNR